MYDGTPTTIGRLFDLDQRVAVVTGASSGVGAAIARTLAEAGAKVALVARRRDRLDKLADEIGGLAVECDLLDLDTVDGLVERIAGEIGGPEILVNAAGNRFGQYRAEDETREAIDQTMTLNVIAPYRLSQQVYPHMKAAGRGSIVNISSISGHVGVPSIPQAAYAISKTGLSGLTRELAIQWGPDGIRTNTIAPGFFQSEITESLYASEKGEQWLRRNLPLPYNGSVDDYVGCVLWLVSDAGRYVTGQTIFIDGGWTAR